MHQIQQPELLNELKQKAQSLKFQYQKMKNESKQRKKLLSNIDIQIQNLSKEKQVQQRKNKSLIVLLAQLQRQFDQTYLDTKQLEQNEDTLLNQANCLRFLLVKEAEIVSDYTKLNTFLKQLESSKKRSSEFLNKTRFLENQMELIAKLKAKIFQFSNSNFQCKRKWADVQRQSDRLQAQIKTLKIQLQRQKTTIKENYEEYLQQANENKTKLVYFNQTRSPSTITQHFVKNIALLQQERVEVEQQNKNLQFHHENLLEQLSRMKIENKELKSFFEKPGQQCKLAQKMKLRVQQLKDSLIEEKRRNSSFRIMKLTNILQHCRKQYNRIKQTNDFLEMKLKQQRQGNFNFNQKDIIQFFTKVVEKKDQSIDILKHQEEGLQERLRQLKIKKSLMENQIEILNQGLDHHGVQQAYKQRNLNKEIFQMNPFTFNKQTQLRLY